MYLQYSDDGGAKILTLRSIAQYLLTIMQYLDFYQVKTVTLDEIEKAADRWARDPKNSGRKSEYSRYAKIRFIRNAICWFKMLGCLEQQVREPIPFAEYLDQYINYMRQEQGLSERTIHVRTNLLQNFLIYIHGQDVSFSEITPLIVDEILIKKHDVDNCCRRTVQSYASVVRVFLRYLENQGWCRQNLASSIKAPRVYRDESLPSAPSWSDVKKLLENTVSDRPTDIRDYAILMLLSVYGMRCSEVTHLCLDDIDWQNEVIYIRRAKRCKPQTFPLVKTVGAAIVRYLTIVRPNCCKLREIFFCVQSPYRPLTSAAVYGIVSRRLKVISPTIEHHGPHALRHACATHLINEGVSLKEISDHLGHQNLDTTRIYARVDLTNLRKVAEFDLGGVL